MRFCEGGGRELMYRQYGVDSESVAIRLIKHALGENKRARIS
jgi:hypothetical protein